MSFYRGMTCENVTLKGDKGTPITAYVAKPAGAGPFPGVVLIHHLPGWSELYIETTRRFAHHGYMAICAWIARRRNYPVERPTTAREKLVATRHAAGVLLLPVIIIGGIRFGLVTETEAAAVAALYALLVSVLSLSPEAAAAIASHGWPGNVRELQNAMAQAVALCDAASFVTLEMLPDGVRPVRAAASRRGSYRARVDAHRRDLIADALDRAGGNRSRAARELGLSRQALLYLIKELKVEDKTRRP